MCKATADIVLPTSIIGSLPRPSWYTASLGRENFLEAMMNLRYREQYEDAVSVFLRAQETAGLGVERGAEREVQSYRPTLPALAQVDADAITFETCSSGTSDLPAIGETVTDKKVVIGVIDHHTLQFERPDQVAALIREALQHVAPERLVISSDCGMGREGMSRRHAAYKMVAMVQGTNLVREELGLTEAECLAADPRYSRAAAKAP